jgi:pimeloyl-ACP methyl ester carboxylesterase
MDPFFFGPPHRRLFGIITAPDRGSSSNGAVLCPPLGLEAVRAHRSLRLLSDQLARAGCTALRFDYFGTGDSLGASNESRPVEWLEDIRVAVQELRERSGVARISLVGLRLGGYLATVAEVRAVSQLVLWDPVTDPVRFAQELEENAYKSEKYGLEVGGFAYSPALLDDLRALSIDDVRRVPREVKIVTSRASPGLPAFRKGVEAKRARVDEVQIDAPPAWGTVQTLGAGAVPVDILQRVTEWVT